MNAQSIVIEQDETILLMAEHFALTRGGLQVIGAPTFEQWQRFGRDLKEIHQIIQLAIGDWLIYGEQRFGETYAQAVDETGIPADRLMNYKWVASRVPPEMRIVSPTGEKDLSYSTYREAARIEKEETRWALLKTASAKGWHSIDMKNAVDKLNGLKAEPPQTDDAIEGAVSAFIAAHAGEVVGAPLAPALAALIESVRMKG